MSEVRVLPGALSSSSGLAHSWTPRPNHNHYSVWEAGGLSQREVAERMGTTQSVVGRLEAGGSKPTIATLERVADALGLRLEVRFEDVKEIPKRSGRRPARKVKVAGRTREAPRPTVVEAAS